MKPTRSGFIAALPHGFAVQPYLGEVVDRVDPDVLHPTPVVINKGRSVGPTTINVNEMRQIAALLRQPSPRPDLIVIDGIGYSPNDALPGPFVFTSTEGDAEREAKWSTSNSNPIDDILSLIAHESSPEAEAARRRAREEDLRLLARLWVLAGYGDLVPPWYRSTP